MPPDHGDDPEEIPDDALWTEDDDPWTDEDERRYQERRALELKLSRRRIRQTLVFLLLVLVVLGAGTTAAGVYQGWWDWPPWEGEAQPSPTASAAPCPTTTPTAAPVEAVTLAVLNSTSRPGLAGATAEELQARGFAVEQIGNDTSGVIEGPAVVRHGPEGLLSARTVAAHVEGAEIVDDGRAGTAVELSLGQAFTGLLPPEDVAAAVGPTPAPSPPGCVVQQPTLTTEPDPGTETAPPTEPEPEG